MDVDTVKNRMHTILMDNQRLLEALYSRWQDEKEFEDFNDYLEHAKKYWRGGGQVIGGKKNKFGFVVLDPTLPFTVILYFEGQNIIIAQYI
jgi:hypothetical protein